CGFELKPALGCSPLCRIISRSIPSNLPALSGGATSVAGSVEEFGPFGRDGNGGFRGQGAGLGSVGNIRGSTHQGYTSGSGGVHSSKGRSALGIAPSITEFGRG